MPVLSTTSACGATGLTSREGLYEPGHGHHDLGIVELRGPALKLSQGLHGGERRPMRAGLCHGIVGISHGELREEGGEDKDGFGIAKGMRTWTNVSVA